MVGCPKAELVVSPEDRSIHPLDGVAHDRAGAAVAHYPLLRHWSVEYGGRSRTGCD